MLDRKQPLRRLIAALVRITEHSRTAPHMEPLPPSLTKQASSPIRLGLPLLDRVIEQALTKGDLIRLSAFAGSFRKVTGCHDKPLKPGAQALFFAGSMTSIQCCCTCDSHKWQHLQTCLPASFKSISMVPLLSCLLQLRRLNGQAGSTDVTSVLILNMSFCVTAMECIAVSTLPQLWLAYVSCDHKTTASIVQAFPQQWKAARYRSFRAMGLQELLHSKPTHTPWDASKTVQLIISLSCVRCLCSTWPEGSAQSISRHGFRQS